MQGIVTCEGTVADATGELLEQRLASGTFFWLDLNGVDDEAHDVLLSVFKIHHLAVDDARSFGQRPKVEDYDDFTYLVVHGASGDGIATDGSATEEVHFIFAPTFVITVHRGACPAMDDARAGGSCTARRPPSSLPRSPWSTW
jgi:magnesium transporter